jgi:hypothetical protein
MGMKRVKSSSASDQMGGEDNEEAKTKSSSKKGQETKMKVVRQSFAVGGLDQEYMEWGMSGNGGSAKVGMTKQQIRQAAREKPFTDFDANKKLRKGGKVGAKAFKSKSKFKRRK